MYPGIGCFWLWREDKMINSRTRRKCLATVSRKIIHVNLRSLELLWLPNFTYFKIYFMLDMLSSYPVSVLSWGGEVGGREDGVVYLCLAFQILEITPCSLPYQRIWNMPSYKRQKHTYIKSQIFGNQPSMC